MDLARQLAVDRVAFADLPDDPALQAQLSETLDDSTGFIVAPAGDLSPADLRDLGQDTLDAAPGIDTVIVRSPDAAAVVSDTYSRAAIEGAQSHLFVEPDYVVGARQFLADVSGFDVPWLAAAAAALVGLVALVAWVAWTVASVRPTGLTGDIQDSK